jgi:hypothetical protein
MVPEAIIRGPRAWTSAGQLAKRFGAAAINQCKRAGLIECWMYDRAGRKLRAPAWTLTDKGAHAYGVRVTEVPNATGLGVPFWASGLDEHGRRKRGVRMATPRMIPEAKAACKGAVVVDEEGKPLVVLGAPVRLDPRLSQNRSKSPQSRKRS